MAISADVLQQELNPAQASYQGGSSMHGVLKFPQSIGVGEEFKNHMSFEAMKVSGGVDTRTLKFQPTGGTVVLPIPSGAVQAAYQQGWEQTGVSYGRAMAASTPIIAGTMSALISGGLGGKGTLDKIKEAVTGKKTSTVTDELSGASGTVTTKIKKAAGAGIAAEATGFAMAIPGASALAEAAQYTIGKRALEQTMMSYSGPGFRTFQYSFGLRPTSEEESNVIEQIIGFFKIRSAPRQEASQFTRIYNIPEVFKIRYYYEDREHDKINRIGHCALTDITVSYGGDKFTTFAGSHAPIQVDLQLQFKEMELLNQQMIQEGY